MNLRESKTRLRLEIASRLKTCSEIDRRNASAQVCSRLESLSLNGMIMAYLPIQDELDLSPYLQTRLTSGAAVPVVDWNSKTMHAGRLVGLDPPDVVVGKHGVRSPAENHPVPAEALQAVLVPGVAFDANCNRLGRGGGFYDRFLELLPSECLTIGIGFDEQLIEAVPIEQWDKQLHHVVTPRGVLSRR